MRVEVISAVSALCVVLAGCGAKTSDKQEAVAQASSEPTWQYGIATDKMRGDKVYWADLRSSNQPELDFPYAGGSPVVLSLSKLAGDPHPDNRNPNLVLANGQFDCSSYSGSESCSISMKVDDKPVVELHAVEADCGSDQCLILHNDPGGPKAEESVIAALRGSKRVTIEVPLYHFGSYQYEFNTAGLNWAKETDRQ